MEKKYSLEKKMTRGEWGNLITFCIGGLFVVGLLYLLEYTVNVGMTFQLDRDEKRLSKINEEVDNLRIRNIGLSKYNRITLEGSKLQSGNIGFMEMDSSKSLKPKNQQSAGIEISVGSKPKSTVKNSDISSVKKAKGGKVKN